MEEQYKEIVLKQGLNIIRKEKEALELLFESLDDTFVEVVDLILNATGRLVISGIGKSALVGTKIVATLNSTGTASLFMHAADAAHGDLGMVQDGDVLLCISKSGETEELTFIQQMVKQYGNKVVAMTSNRNSTLGKDADYILYTPIEEEADPNNLAPTSSSTVQMAMGDALAMSLSTIKGFTAKNFAKYHPGGSLGRQLYLRVGNVLKTGVQPSVKLTDDLRTIIVEMTSKRLGATVVLNENDHIEGIITDGDLRRMLNENESIEHLTAAAIMSKNPKIIQINDMAVEALEIMRSHSISQLIVMNDNQYIGLIHIHDLLEKGL